MHGFKKIRIFGDWQNITRTGIDQNGSYINTVILPLTRIIQIKKNDVAQTKLGLSIG